MRVSYQSPTKGQSMTVASIEQSPEWQEKLSAEAKLKQEQQAQLLCSADVKAFNLQNLIPSNTEINGRAILLTANDKSLIVAYAFIGLSELVSASSGQTLETIWTACIERSIRNLKKDGLLA